MGKRIAAVVLSLLLMLLCGCSAENSASILCIEELLPSARALSKGENGFTYAAAESDLAAVQQLSDGKADCVLLTVPGYEALYERYELDMVWSGGLTQFCILSSAGRLSDWTKNTRVVIVGERGNYADFMAQQVLTCAFYGSLRYEDEQTALEALKSGKVDAVLGFFAVKDAETEKVLLSMKDLSLEPIPDSLVTLNLPGDEVEKANAVLGDKTAKSVVVPGVLVCADGLDENLLEMLLNQLNDSTPQ